MGSMTAATHTGPLTGRWVNTRQAADHYNADIRTIRSWINNGTITGQRFGRQYRVWIDK